MFDVGDGHFQKINSVKKKVFFSFDQSCGPSKHFSKTAKQVSLGKNIPWDAANNCYVNHFFSTKKLFKKDIKK